MKLTAFTLCTALLLALTYGCQKDLVSETNSPFFEEYDYTKANSQSDFFQGPIDNKSAALGRVLFYDETLSFTNSASCASCHVQSKGFADGLALSKGFNNQETELHSMSLVNMGMSNKFFWDGRATNLKTQVMMPIANHIEMGIEDQQLLLDKVKSTAYYPELFEKAYGDKEVTLNRIGDALGTFVASLVSVDTKFDQWKRNETVLSANEQRGLELFNSTYNCSSCHQGENFNSAWGGNDFANIGLTKEPINTEGKFERFKIPNLRNVAVSAPYMHDGSLTTLEEVLDHYSAGIEANPYLDWRLREDQTGQAIRLNITPQDKKDIIAFLHTLTDQELLTHPRFSSPF